MAKETSKELEASAPGNEIEASVLAEMEAAGEDAKKDIDMQEDARIPELSMLQATSNLDDGGTPGQILDTLTGTALNTVDVIPITMYKNRVLFGSQLGEAPECSSPNALDGYGNPGDQLTTRGPQGGGSCKACPEARWQQGGRCKLRYNYLTVVLGDESAPYDFEHEVPRAVGMQGTSAKVASKLNTMMLSGKYPWSGVIRLSTVGEKNDRGTYRVWAVQKVRDATMTEMLHAFKLSKQIASSRSGIGETAPAAEAAPATGDGDIPF